jgi:Phd_YefM.
VSRKQYGIEDARKILGDLVTAAQQGTDIILTRHRRPVARITRYQEDTMTTTTIINIGDQVIVDAEQVPEGWVREGEVVSTDGQSYVVELEDGHRCEVLPDQMSAAAVEHFTAWVTTDPTAVVVLADQNNGDDDTPRWESTGDPLMHAVTTVDAHDGSPDDAMREAMELLTAHGWQVSGEWEAVPTGYVVAVERA